MTFQPHYRIQVNGAIRAAGADIEIWSYGLAFGVPGTALNTVGPLSPSAMTAVGAAITTYHASGGAQIAAQARIRNIKVAELDINGHYVNPPQILGPLDIAGGSATNPYPPQVTYCVSTKGPAAVTPVRGRWYVPLPVMVVDGNTMAMAPANALSAVTAAKTLVNALRVAVQAFSPTLDVVIASSKGVGTNAQITELRVGTVFDTQRRRRNDLIEQYSVVTTP